MKKKILIVLVGLPGTGKTTACNLLRKEIECHFFNSDKFAKQQGLFKKKRLWKKSEKEINKIRKEFYFKKAKEIAKLLSKNNIVIMDAASNKEFLRRILYDASKKAKGRTVIIEIIAPLKLTKERIFKDKKKNAKSRWEAYLKIREKWQPIKRKHYTINSSKDIKEQIEKIMKKLCFKEIKKESLNKLIKEVIFKNKKAIKDYKKGEKKALQFLIGCVVKKTKGQANAKEVTKLLLSKINKL